MRKSLIAIAVLIMSLAFTAPAQTVDTNAPPPTPQSFYDTTILYFSSVDTNMMFTPFKLWTSMDYQNNINFAAGINVSYDILQPASYAKGISLGFECGMRNAGIAGVIVDGKGGLNVGYNYYSIRLEGYADGGYSDANNNGFGEIGARLLKKATPNTFFGMSLSGQFPHAARGGPAYPIVGVIAGATF
jgi:hypothetical protein